jgi:hypothetical protein
MITAWALQAGQKLRDSRLSRRAILCWYGVPQGKGEQWTLKFETKAPPALSLRPVAEVILRQGLIEHNDVQGAMVVALLYKAK